MKNTTNTTSSGAKIIPIYSERAHIEREIDQHVQSIRSLISRLRPSERQNYFNGLLSHLLHSEQAETSPGESSVRATDQDYSKLSDHDLGLIRELSFNVNRLYLELGDQDS